MSPLEHLQTRLSRAARITVLTGAGVSAASGVPTFRGADGLWNSRRAEDLATPGAFTRDPHFVWQWYDWRRQRVAAAEPNAAHQALATWSRGPKAVTVITQNVDGLHERAGTAAVVRLHGSLWRLRCWSRCRGGDDGWHDEMVPLPTLPPHCPHCGGLARPGVVWFGEALDPRDVTRARAACRCDVFLAVGTSAVVHPAAGLIDEARRRGAYTVEINPDPTEATAAVDVSLRSRAEDVLPALIVI